MATATLTFDLNDLDDRFDHLRAVRSTDLAIALFQIVHNTRKRVENRVEVLDDKVGPYEAIDIVYSTISEVLNEYGIDIDSFIQ